MTFAITLSLANLLLYCVQQLGVTLGVGAETVFMIAYIQSIRDGFVDDSERGFARAVRRIMDLSLFLIITSGIGIVAVGLLAGQFQAFSTVFLFKWSLIGIVLLLLFGIRGTSLTAGLLEGLAGGTWYALFAVHILAPTATWVAFAVFYTLWLVGFCIFWTAMVFAFRNTSKNNAVSKPAALRPQVIPLARVITPRAVPPPVVRPPVAASAPTPASKPAPAAPAHPLAASALSGKPLPPPKPSTMTPSPARPVGSAPPMPPLPGSDVQFVPSFEPASAHDLALHVMPKTPEEVEQRKSFLANA